MKRELLDKILYLSIFIFIVILGIFLFFNYFKPSPVKGLKINFIGPNEVSSLENYSYNLLFENNSNQNLTEVNLKILLSNGAFFVERPQEKETSIYLGEIGAKKSYNQQINLFFLNEGEFKESIKIILSYKIGDKPNVFEKEESFSVNVKNPPLKTQIFLPNKIYVNQEFQASFQVVNLTKQKLENLRIIIEPPEYFNLVSSFPASQNYYFQFPSIDALETKSISLIGQIQNIKSSGVFSVKLQFNFLNKTFSLPKEITKINLLENPVAFYIKTTPESNSIPIGSNLFYEITVENRTQEILENNEVRVIFSGPFDLLSLNSDGYFSEINKTLLWNSRNKEELLRLKPGDKVNLRFSISLFQSYPILGENNKNFTAKIRVEFRSLTIPVEVETGGKEYIVWQEDEKKIVGNIVVSQDVYYNDEYFPETDEFSLQPNQPINLSWHIKIKTIGEDFNNFVLNAKFPIWTNLTGKVNGDAVIDNLKFDSRTGNFAYSLNKLPANLGYLDKEIDLVFQIKVIPPTIPDLGNLIIAPQINYSATGEFSKAQISGNVKEIFASQIIK